jgi:15-cis-phytoene synthase
MISNHDVSVDALTRVIDGWAVLLDDPPYDDATLLDYARLRGAGLFAIAAQFTQSAINDRAGVGWALTDFARHCTDAETAKRAMTLAQDALRDNSVAELPKPMRSFAILTRFAQADCQRPLDEQRVAGSPYRIIQAIGFIMFGR